MARWLSNAHLIELPGDCMLEHGVPKIHVRSDNLAEMPPHKTEAG
jgi:hypothetical protein